MRHAQQNLLQPSALSPWNARSNVLPKPYAPSWSQLHIRGHRLGLSYTSRSPGLIRKYFFSSAIQPDGRLLDGSIRWFSAKTTILAWRTNF